MSYHFSMGAINKNTDTYEYPRIANKKNKYKCPGCEKDVIFKKGLIKQPHFAHYKSDNPCYYYDKPSETQIHKDAKMLMKSLLDNKKNISIHRDCRNCRYSERVHYDIWNDEDYNENTRAVIEYKFYYNHSNRSADVALIENDKIKYIFEICYKNKTKEENRPEPWIEINAEDLIHKINSGEIIDEEGNISIECIRNYKCDFCLEYEEELENKRREKLENEYLIKEQKRKWRLEYERRQKLESEYLIKEQERKRRESLKQKEEEERIRREKQEKMGEECKCGIMIINLCICQQPKYKLNTLSNNLFCMNCNRWKCRCKE